MTPRLRTRKFAESCVAREVLICPRMKTNNGNQGEGDKASARRYNKNAEEFVADGRVDEAAADAREFVEAEPEEAQAAERAAKSGPPSDTEN